MSSILLLLLSSVTAFGHSNLSVNGNVPPRSADTGLKTAPCGNIARTATPKRFDPGSTITVQWQETINHPGHFEFSFSQANDLNFQLLKSVPDDQNNPIPAGGNPHQYTTTVTLPNVQCTACTFRLIQVMEENPAMPSFYYSCADIQLMPASASPPPAPTPTPAPAPPPGNNCSP
jgi:hypothetical protein